MVPWDGMDRLGGSQSIPCSMPYPWCPSHPTVPWDRLDRMGRSQSICRMPVIPLGCQFCCSQCDSWQVHALMTTSNSVCAVHVHCVIVLLKFCCFLRLLTCQRPPFGRLLGVGLFLGFTPVCILHLYVPTKRVANGTSFISRVMVMTEMPTIQRCLCLCFVCYSKDRPFPLYIDLIATRHSSVVVFSVHASAVLLLNFYLE